MNQGIVQISHAEDGVNVLTLYPYNDNSKRFPKPLEIIFQKETVKPLVSWMLMIVICVPELFPYENIKAVP